MACVGWYNDSPGKFTECPPNPALNRGGAKRAHLIAKSKKFQFIGKPALAMFHQERLLIPGVPIRLKFTRAAAKFCLLGGTTHVDGGEDIEPDFKVLITNAVFLFRKVKVNDTVHARLLKELELSNALYPITRAEIRAMSLSQGDMAFEHLLLNNAQPKKILICFVTTESFNGSYNTNPLEFITADLNYLAITQDNNSTILGRPLQPNFAEKLHMKEYHNLFTGTGTSMTDLMFDLRYDDITGGYCFFAFNSQPQLQDAGYVNLQKGGPLRIEMKFAEPLDEPLMCLAYCEFDECIEITRSKSVIYDKKLV